LRELPRPVTDTEVLKIDEGNIYARVSDSEVKFRLPNRGIHFALDAAAALESARRYLGNKFDAKLAAKTLNDLPPVFARGEITKVNEIDVEFILVQNPMSFQLNLDNLPQDQEQLMVAIGRDVHDPSWLWTVDLANMPKVSVVTGFNYAEMALRLAYEGIEIEKIEPDLEKAIDDFFGMPAPKTGRRTVIFSADAMRRTRRYLGFTDPEAVER
jgi:UDP-N-acetylmuramyl tripeptide synthase